MNTPPVVSPQEWQREREALLVAEKELTRAQDALAARRRRLPMVEFGNHYRSTHPLVAPVRIADVTQPVHLTLPGIAHRFAAGHRVALYLAGGDPNYRGGLAPTPVTVSSGSAGQLLSLPVVG